MKSLANILIGLMLIQSVCASAWWMQDDTLTQEETNRVFSILAKKASEYEGDYAKLEADFLEALRLVFENGKGITPKPFDNPKNVDAAYFFHQFLREQLESNPKKTEAFLEKNEIAKEWFSLSVPEFIKKIQPKYFEVFPAMISYSYVQLLAQEKIDPNSSIGQGSRALYESPYQFLYPNLYKLRNEKAKKTYDSKKGVLRAEPEAFGEKVKVHPGAPWWHSKRLREIAANPDLYLWGYKRATGQTSWVKLEELSTSAVGLIYLYNQSAPGWLGFRPEWSEDGYPAYLRIVLSPVAEAKEKGRLLGGNLAFGYVEEGEPGEENEFAGAGNEPVKITLYADKAGEGFEILFEGYRSFKIRVNEESGEMLSMDPHSVGDLKIRVQLKNKEGKSEKDANVSYRETFLSGEKVKDPKWSAFEGMMPLALVRQPYRNWARLSQTQIKKK